MKDSQLLARILPRLDKYIKADNERFSTVSYAAGITW